MSRQLLVCLFACAFTCCVPKKPGPGPGPVRPDPGDAEGCAAACAHLRELGCEEGEPLEDGTSCEAFCEETEATGHALNVSCVASVASCAALESCQ